MLREIITVINGAAKQRLSGSSSGVVAAARVCAVNDGQGNCGVPRTGHPKELKSRLGKQPTSGKSKGCLGKASGITRKARERVGWTHS